MRVSYSTLVKAKRAGRATSVRVAPTGTAVEQYQVPLGNRHSLKEAGVIGLPSWSEKATQTETWAKVPRLSATCPLRVVTFDGGKGSIDRCMEFGDDFDGTALNTAKWTSITGSGVAVSGGELIIQGSNATTTPGVKSVSAFNANTELRTRFELPTGTASKFLGFLNAAGTTYAQFGRYNLPYRSISYVSSGEEINNISSPSGRVLGRILRNGATNVQFDINGANLKTHTSDVPSGDHMIQIYLYNNPSTNFTYVDWIIVRKYVANDPLAGTAQPSSTNRALSRPMRKADLIRACCT